MRGDYIFGSVTFTPADVTQWGIYADCEDYKRWSIRAKMRAMAVSPRRIEKTCARAVKGSLAKAISREMNWLVLDLRRRHNEELLADIATVRRAPRLTFWQKVREALWL